MLQIQGCLAQAGEEGGQVVLVGLSLGGLVAAWAATGPERVDAAALVAPPCDLAGVFRETPIGRRYGALASRAGAPVPEGPELARGWNAPLREYARGHLTLLLACAAVRRDVAAFAADRGAGTTSSRPAARP
jgi:pimeloyl-ACP methyl ester carboxylesterase